MLAEDLLRLQFGPDQLPTDCVAFVQPRAGEPEQVIEHLHGQVAQFVRIDPAPGTYGIRWSWGEA